MLSAAGLGLVACIRGIFYAVKTSAARTSRGL